jgi:hypothetical protein
MTPFIGWAVGVQVFGNYKGPGMWIDHWNSLIALQPDFVEIVTWNDYPYAHTLLAIIFVLDISAT